FLATSLAVELLPAEARVVQVALRAEAVVVTEGELVLLEPVYFDFDRDAIRSESLPVLDEVVAKLDQHAATVRSVEVQGHTDDRGSNEYNRDLSQRRVDAVMAYLVGHGIAAERLMAVGYGEACPLASNLDDEGRATNRR